MKRAYNEPAPKCKSAIGPGPAPEGILNLRSSVIARIMHFSIYFASSEFSRRATKSHERGYFARVFESVEYASAMPPSVLMSMSLK